MKEPEESDIFARGTRGLCMVVVSYPKQNGLAKVLR
jgi:hypothetical protein